MNTEKTKQAETKTCFNCIYSFGAIEHLKEHSTLICWPSGNQEREQLAYKICDEYKREVEKEEHEKPR